MPLVRTLSGRSKPRTPQIPQTPRSPPTFQPPSHYAAAAVIQYSRTDGQRKNSSSSGTSRVGISSSSFFSDSYNRSTSISYPSETDSITASSFDNQSSSQEGQTKASERHRRQSLVTELPQMEAHLLPSLRDTIDRMTRSPGGRDVEPEESYMEQPRPQVRSRLPTPNSARAFEAKSSPKTSHARNPTSAQSYHHSPTFKQEHRRTRHAKSSALTPQPEKNSQQSGLVFSGMDAPTEASSRRLSLRSPRTRIQNPPTSPRAHGGRSAESSQGQRFNSAIPTRMQNLHRRTRSRSDPGVPPSIGPLDRHRPAPKQDGHRTPISNIPRPRRAQTQLDDSDLEQRYEEEIRSRRKLVVTNAIIGPPSSSESENERHLSSGQTNAVSQPAYTSPIGLGFNLPVESARYGWATPRSDTGEPRHDHLDHPPSISPYYPSEARARSRARKEAVDRRAALYHHIMGRNPPGHHILDSDESEYLGEDGFAISSSWNRTEGSLEESHEDYPIYPGQSQPRRGRSKNTCAPLTPKMKDNGFTSTDPRIHPAPDFQEGFNSRQYYEPRSSSIPTRHRRRVPSRSPVIASNDPPPLPAALKRHSVYHRSPNPPIAHEPEQELSGSPTPSFNQNPTGIPQPPDPSTLASRERQAYGIPESNSERILLGAHSETEGSVLVPDECDLSSEASVYLDEAEDSELSAGAENLLKGLDAQKNYHTPEARFSQGSAPSSHYDSDPGNDQQFLEDHHTPSVNYRPTDSVEEAQRSITEDLYRHQQNYVEHLHAFLMVFIIPLRCQNSRRWIAGVPGKVCRLFDWFEDILVLHQQIVGTVEDHQLDEGSTLEHLAEALRCLVPRFEVYQPYLVKHTEVLELIQRSMEDSEDEFGEFMRMQGSQLLTEDQNFCQVLLEPINHLGCIQNDYMRLLGATPKTSAAYLPLFLLVHSFQAMARVLKEVQAREEEYTANKRLTKRIRALPPGLKLASRDRRLLHSGAMLLLGSYPMLTGQISDSSDPSIESAPNGSSWQRAKKNLNGHSGSKGSVASYPSSSGSSIGSDMKRVSFLPSLRTPKLIKKTLLRKPSYVKTMTRADTSPLSSEVEVFVYSDLLLVISPEAGLQKHLSTTVPHDYDDKNLICLPILGCTRIIDVKTLSRSLEGLERTVFELDVIPIGETGSGNQEREPLRIHTLQLSVPQDSTAGPTHPSTDASAEQETCRNDCENRWTSAFERCSRSCLSLLSSTASNDLRQRTSTGLEPETYPVVVSLLASGLPLPKSPSSQNQQAEYAKLDDEDDPEASKEGEREERGWWSLRFQQVYTELKRAEMAGPLGTRVE